MSTKKALCACSKVTFPSNIGLQCGIKDRSRPMEYLKLLKSVTCPKASELAVVMCKVLKNQQNTSTTVTETFLKMSVGTRVTG